MKILQNFFLLLWVFFSYAGASYDLDDGDVLRVVPTYVFQENHGAKTHKKPFSFLECVKKNQGFILTQEGHQIILEEGSKKSTDKKDFLAFKERSKSL